jgi:hypothetical protein
MLWKMVVDNFPMYMISLQIIIILTLLTPESHHTRSFGTTSTHVQSPCKQKAFLVPI